MGGWGPIVVAGVIVGTAFDACAQASDFPCGSEIMATARVVRVVDGRSFVLDDGREIRLSALEVPAETDAMSAGRDALAAFLSDQTVELRQAAAAADRYGRILAHAYVAERPGHSAAHAMLVRGHARVAAHVDSAACAAALFSQERVARTDKLGLWGDPRYAIMDAGDLAGLVSRQGRFAVIEGRVVSVRESGGTIYVNFGRRWSQALTVTISKRQERIFAGAGLPPQRLENRRLRVRGWVEFRNGPRIEASRPEQIEFAELN
jgi:endonuclease YncB( thermonuclease family)